IGIVGDDVRAEGAGLERPGVIGFTARAEHDPTAERPRQLRVVDLVALAVDDGLLEAERLDKEADEATGVAGAQRRPHLGWWSVISHDLESAATSVRAAWTFRNS